MKIGLLKGTRSNKALSPLGTLSPQPSKRAPYIYKGAKSRNSYIFEKFSFCCFCLFLTVLSYIYILAFHVFKDSSLRLKFGTLTT